MVRWGGGGGLHSELGRSQADYFQARVEPIVDSIYRGGVGCESKRKSLFIGDREVAIEQQSLNVVCVFRYAKHGVAYFFGYDDDYCCCGNCQS